MLVGIAKQPLHYEGSALLAGYAAKRMKSGFLDDLYVQAILFKDKEITGFVVFDLCAIDHLIIDAIKEKLKDIDLDNIIFSATHTHSGYAGTIDTEGLLKYTKMAFFDQDDKLIDFIAEKAAKCIKEAIDNFSEGKIASSMSYLKDVGANRNSEEFAGDNSLNCYVIENKTKRSVAINYACHPTILQPVNTKVSGDFVSVYRDLMLKDFDASLYLQGACGDISTRYTRRGKDYNEVIRNADVLYTKVLETISSKKSNINIELKKATFMAKTKEPKDLETSLQDIKNYQNIYEELKGQDEIKEKQALVRLQGEQATYVYSKYYQGIKEFPFVTYFLKINDEYFISVPGELYSELITDFDKQKYHFIGYAMGYASYIANNYAYDNSYYEALMCPWQKGEGERYIDFIKKHLDF